LKAFQTHTPDKKEVLEAAFFNLSDVPENTNPYLKEKLRQLGPTFSIDVRLES